MPWAGKNGQETTDLITAREDLGELEYDDEYELSPQEQRAAARSDNLVECFGICLFFFYLVVFSVSALLEQSAAKSRLADHIIDKLEATSFSLESVRDIPSYYEYLEKTFVASMYENATDTMLARQMSNYLHPMDVSNRMIGSARIRQVRVMEKENCQINPMFSHYVVPCYPAFTLGNNLIGRVSTESTASYGPEGKFTWSEDDDGSGFSGILATYPADGFMELLSTNRTKALLKIDQLRRENFMGPATRAAFLDFSVWSANTGTYAAVTIAVEFGALGSTAHKTSVLMLGEQTLQPAGNKGTKDIVGFVLIIVMVLFVVYYIFEEGKELRESKLHYFLDAWNVLDWINMILILIAFVVRLMVFTTADSMGIGEGALRDRDSFANLRGLAITAEMIRLVTAGNAVLLWLKCAKYLRKVPIVKKLIRTIWSALALFLPFLFMFGLLFIGFVISYNVGFGDKFRELATFSSTVVYLARAFLRDVKLRPAYDITPLFGAGMILLFYVSLVLVSVTVVNAIFSDAIFRGKQDKPKKTFSLLKKEDIEIHEDEPVEEFVREISQMYWKGIEELRDVLPPSVSRFLPRRDRRRKVIVDDEEPARIPLEDQGAEELFDEDGRVLMDGYDEDDIEFEVTADFSKKAASRRDILQAIQHMSGRVLSEISIVGIEVKSELHDVCERVAQMQMAVEELAWRADKVKEEQEKYLK